MTEVTVLLADDHPIVCDGISKLLAESVDIKLVGEAHDGEQALAMVEELQPDVLLLDMELPKISGVEIAKRLSDDGSATRILALSTYDDPEYINAVLEQGAAGYLIKDEVPTKIADAIRGVARGEKGWLSRSAASELSRTIQRDAGGPEELTGREMQVLQAVVEGKTNAQIGVELDISDKTVEKHLESVYKKLNVSSRVEAAVMAVRQSLFE
ncbi:MAG: response regulator [Anaerolineales bacterium]